jgi:hypothetical protein
MAGRQLYESKNFFFCKKRSRKTFGPAGCGTGIAKAHNSKSFLLLFFKKEALSFERLFDELDRPPHAGFSAL